MKTAKQKKMLIEELEKNPIISYACKKTGIARATYYRWIAKNEKFAEKAEKALERGIVFTNDLADFQLISLMRDRNLPAIKFWSLHRHPAYSEKLQLLKPSEPDDKKLTPEESALINGIIERDYGIGRDRKSENLRSVRIYKALAYSIAS